MAAPVPAALTHAREELRRFPALLRAQVAAVLPEQFDWCPDSWEGSPSETLTIRQQLCHLRDIEAEGYVVRFTRLLREEDPLLASIDGDALVESRGYNTTPVEAALAGFEAARGQTLQLLAGLKAGDLARRGRFAGYGPVTVTGLVHFLCSHDQQHLSGIQWVLGKHAAA